MDLDFILGRSNTTKCNVTERDSTLSESLITSIWPKTTNSLKASLQFHSFFLFPLSFFQSLLIPPLDNLKLTPYPHNSKEREKKCLDSALLQIILKSLLVTLEPFNVEPPSSGLTCSYVTPSNFFYKRNHGPIPIVEDIEKHPALH
ncbi:hypothetical protein HN51_016776, partial [Arachis hypogaea]